MFGIQDLVHQAMLNVDAAGAGASEIADELLERGRSLERIFRENAEKGLGPRAKTRVRDSLCVFLSLSGEDDPPGRHYQPGLLEVRERGVFSPRRIDARIPGIETR